MKPRYYILIIIILLIGLGIGIYGAIRIAKQKAEKELIATAQVKYQQIVNDPKSKYCEVDEDCDIVLPPECCSCPKVFNKEYVEQIKQLPRPDCDPEISCKYCYYWTACQERECIKCQTNSCEIVFPSSDKQSVEKEVFVDEFMGVRASFWISWDGGKGDLEINIIRPDGTVITRENAETNSKIQWNQWRDITSGATIHVFQPESGTWKVRATPISNKELIDFTLKLTGRGTINMVFYLGSNKKSYARSEKPLISGTLSGPVAGVKGVEIFGTVLHPNGTKTDFNLYDDGVEEHGDDYQNDGRYYNYFIDFSESGFYKFEMTAKNINGMTVEPGDSPYISLPPPGVPLPESKPVPPFTRETELTIEIK